MGRATATMAIGVAWEQCECSGSVKIVAGGTSATQRGVVMTKACKAGALKLVPMSEKLNWTPASKVSKGATTFPDLTYIPTKGEMQRLCIGAPDKSLHVPFFQHCHYDR